MNSDDGFGLGGAAFGDGDLRLNLSLDIHIDEEDVALIENLEPAVLDCLEHYCELQEAMGLWGRLPRTRAGTAASSRRGSMGSIGITEGFGG